MKANTEPYPPREVVVMLNDRDFLIDAGEWIDPSWEADWFDPDQAYEEYLERKTWEDEAFEAWEARWVMRNDREGK